MSDEGLELLGVRVAFPARTEADGILSRFADHQMIAEMKKVFFAEQPNSIGHSYAKLIRGPEGRHDFQDVIALLDKEPWTKRALVTLSCQPSSKVPCINAVQFLVRDGAVKVMYFARGQDAFRKFYADAICIATMAEKVASGLRLPAGQVEGFIGSSHIYHRDMPAIRETLNSAKHDFASHRTEGALA